MPKLNAPVILISGGSASSASVQAAATMIAGQGAIPMILSNHFGRVGDMNRDELYAEVGRILKKSDGIMIMGNNNDIDPSEYGQEKHPKTNSELYNKDGSVNGEGMARRNYEVALMQVALAEGMPMFGICGGMQRMSVLCGGTLTQHVPDETTNPDNSAHAQQETGIPPFMSVQPVTIKQGTTLGAIGEEVSTLYTPMRTDENDIRLDVNSMHHQAVAKVGTGLRVAATANDSLKDGSRIIEAIEIDPNGPLANTPQGARRFGIFTQWHPEFSDSPIGAKISKHFTEAALLFAKATGREHSLEGVRDEHWVSALPVLKQPEPNSILGKMADMIVQQERSRDPSLGIKR